MTGSEEGLPARRAALAALRAVEEDDAYSTLAVPAAVADLDSSRDRAFASHLAYDTLRWSGTLEWALGHVVDRRLEDVEPALRRLLLLGALQLMRTDIVPRAVVHTSAELAREVVPGGRGTGAAGFINGVLRALDRRRSELPWPDPSDDPVAHLALRTGHPTWIVEELLPRLDVNEIQALLEADNEPPGVTLRAVGDRDALLAELRDAGVDATPGAHAPEAVRAPGADPRSLAAVVEGRAVPQDEASMLVVRAVGAREGERIVDLCAGPGGKATHLAQVVGPDGQVVATDIHPHRAALVASAAARVGVRVDVVAADGRSAPLRRVFDRALVDAPCTGLGTGRRRPEVRWRRRSQDVVALARLQRDLLTAAGALVRPGGTVTYAACTWTEAETTAVVGSVGAELEVVDERQLWPHRDGTDGMYYCTLVRR